VKTVHRNRMSPLLAYNFWHFGVYDAFVIVFQFRSYKMNRSSIKMCILCHF
jgi:hypothetical protein